MSVHRIRPQVVARTVCPDGHTNLVEAINPVVIDGLFVEGFWPSAFDFCMECEQGVVTAEVEVQR